ncbi:hypothetical protein BDZ91DRAFT_727936 [Kalaharituber pfeilii]|nr:hypothetical protein BDZ91DRAFT_727936 [Kalaharituber pfeilii]
MSTHSDDGANLLSESTYEILSESTLLMTDDEEDEGSSVNSFDDDCSVGDITNIEDADSLHDYTYTQETHEHPGTPNFGGLDEFHMASSANTLREEPVPVAQIEFEEPPNQNGLISVRHTIQEFTTEEATSILSQLAVEHPPDRLLCTVRQTMCQELLCLDEPFRFLYVGTASAKDEIFNKLGAALALPVVEGASSTISSDSKSSRFNVVPVTSFGLKSSPEVELIESFGVEMSLDVCSQAGRTKVPGRPDTLSLCLNGNQWVRSIYSDDGFRLEAPGWKLPHLAVVFISEEDTLEQKLTRVYTQSFVGRHAIPTLMISQKPLCYKPAEKYTSDAKSIHMCLESRSSKTGEVVYKRLPIDLCTFNSLDVRQMNRNLACVTGLAKSFEERPSTEIDRESTDSITLMHDVEKQPHTKSGLRPSFRWVQNNKPRDILMVAAINWLFICGIVGGLFAIAYMKFSRDHTGVPVSTSLDTAQSVTGYISPYSTMTSSEVSTSVLPAPIKSTSVSRSKMSTTCTQQGGIAGLLPEPTPLAANDSQEFKVHIIGENNIIVRPPQQYTVAKKPPPMLVKVTRNGEHIDSEFSKLFDGVYTVVIPRDDAWGLLNVSIQTKSKPLMKETFELDFGMPWLKLTGWKKLAAQQKEEVVKIAGQASAQGKRIAGEISHKTAQMKHETKKLLGEKVKKISEDVSGHMSRLYKVSSSLSAGRLLRKAGSLEYVKKAQRQAVNVWDKMELIKGASVPCGNSEGCGKKTR